MKPSEERAVLDRAMAICRNRIEIYKDATAIPFAVEHLHEAQIILELIDALPLTTESAAGRVTESAPLSRAEDSIGTPASAAAHIPTDAEAIEAEQLSEAAADPLEPVAVWLDSQDFYELCQSYRHAKDWESYGMQTAAEAFEELKREIRKHAIPPGYCVVPEEPTEAIIDAASRWFFAYQHTHMHDKSPAIAEAYKAMLAAGGNHLEPTK